MTKSILSDEEKILKLGFKKVGNWEKDGELIKFKQTPGDPQSVENLLSKPALYAFVVIPEGTDEKIVKYIGKVECNKPLKSRLNNYKNTNGEESYHERSRLIRNYLENPKNVVEIYALKPAQSFKYLNEISINLIDGLEYPILCYIFKGREKTEIWNKRCMKNIANCE